VYLDAYLNESKLFYEVAQDRWAASWRPNNSKEILYWVLCPREPRKRELLMSGGRRTPITPYYRDMVLWLLQQRTSFAEFHL
jgi:hypothetical protein